MSQKKSTSAVSLDAGHSLASTSPAAPLDAAATLALQTVAIPPKQKTHNRKDTIWERARALLQESNQAAPKTKASTAAPGSRGVPVVNPADAALRQQLSEAHETIRQQSAELAELRAGRDQILDALQKLELESANTLEGLTSRMKRETDPVKLAAIRRQIISMARGDTTAENQHGDAIAALTSRMKAERDPVKTASIRAQIIALAKAA